MRRWSSRFFFSSRFSIVCPTGRWWWDFVLAVVCSTMRTYTCHSRCAHHFAGHFLSWHARLHYTTCESMCDTLTMEHYMCAAIDIAVNFVCLSSRSAGLFLLLDEISNLDSIAMASVGTRAISGRKKTLAGNECAIESSSPATSWTWNLRILNSKFLFFFCSRLEIGPRRHLHTEKDPRRCVWHFSQRLPLRTEWRVWAHACTGRIEFDFAISIHVRAPNDFLSMFCLLIYCLVSVFWTPLPIRDNLC